MNEDRENIGDGEFPLEVDLEQMDTKHDLVGKAVEVAPYAQEVMRPLHGRNTRVVGVFLKHGQVAGLAVELDGKRFYGPKKDFFIKGRYTEDIHLNTALAQDLRETLSHFSIQHDYYGSAWAGVEKLCFELAKRTMTCAVESRGWYRYPSSTRPAQDGANWRYVVPHERPVDGAVCINANSLLHDGVWTLTTSVYSTREVDTSKLELIRHGDHWRRTLLWARRTVRALERDNKTVYPAVIRDFDRRLRAQGMLYELRDEFVPKILAAIKKEAGIETELPELSMGLANFHLDPGRVGRYDPPSDAAPYGILTATPDALSKPAYLREIVKHELLHYVLTTTKLEDNHGEVFQAIADAVGLPKKYQD